MWLLNALIRALQSLAVHLNAFVLSSTGIFIIVCFNCVMSTADYNKIVVHVYEGRENTIQIFMVTSL